MIKLVHDPLKEIVNIVKRKYPKLNVEIHFSDTIKTAGVTRFPTSKRYPILIELNVEIPYFGVVDVLAHELAHAICGPDVKRHHGKEWKAAFEWIHGEYCRRVERWRGAGE